MNILPDSPYPVIPVVVAEVEEYADEHLGSKKKFWVLRDGAWWLYKQARPSAPGEAWAERIAAEIASLLGISHAVVELANEAMDGLGTISRSFMPPDGRLDHGNDILNTVIPGYDRPGRMWVPEHNIANIVNAIRNLQGADGVNLDFERILAGLASYAVLDGLISNVDRHHENWGLIYSESTRTYSLSPSYDHASSLGRNLTDDQRNARLNSGGGAGGLPAYLANRAGRVFVDPTRKRGPSPLLLAQLICLWRPDLVRPTLKRLADTPVRDFRSAIYRAPPEIMSRTAKKFAYQMVDKARNELLRGFE